MQSTAPVARNRLGLFVIGLLLGPVVVMLWLGRWKYACLYFIASIFLAFTFFALPMLGAFDPIALNGIAPEHLLEIFLLPLNLIGLAHAFILNGRTVLRPFYSRWYIALPSPILISFAVAFLIAKFLYHPFDIPSASNFPNYIIGDYFFVSETAYSFGRKPQRGDFAAFKYPAHLKITYIKRVVGLPGDHVQLIHGVLNINGVAMKLEPVDYKPEKTDENGANQFYRETLANGRSYVIAKSSQETPQENTQEYTVPPEHYFVLGDSRDNSLDSRFLDKVGYIPEQNFIGRSAVLYWNRLGLSISNRPAESYPK